MPDDNRISGEITAAVKAQVLTKIQEIFDLLTLLINLARDDKRGIPTIGPERAGMIDIFIPQMTANPTLVPSYVNMTEVAADRKLYFDLQDIASPAAALLEALTDTKHVAGSDLFLAFTAYYKNLQEASRRNVPGVDSLLDALRPFFARRTQPASPTTPPTPNP